MEDDETAGAAEGRFVGEAAARTLLLLPGGARAHPVTARLPPLCRAARRALRRREVCVVAGIVLLRECRVRLTAQLAPVDPLPATSR